MRPDWRSYCVINSFSDCIDLSSEHDTYMLAANNAVHWICLFDLFMV